ncbi:heptatricopeptide repeat-containing protein, putative [Plasmodium chabaudi chabaudi]|uniref:Heptatricopeptide repeat-containing protein, putative n=1 Tax=Plasmodium chabaudi chabaudi TaxID=31271 RepID=A0A4V0JZU8_PLACU|nr:heptatricopeptide repeat-containing protein, putative [Plasmodium chabaudi chabaudi]VTZ66255.1 heptatricopeptide repeat-containing protein, putative [Plasmodium chabaudi chabaudi]|eukprot:XP_016652996.1 conserved Plasmodium protein, unknown function [Plasmodium chabaudi chabaudi]
MFNYFLKGFNNCKNKVDVDHLSRKFLKHIYNFNAYEISLCLNKFSKINYNEKDFWNRVCKLITSNDKNVLTRFEVVKSRQLEKHEENSMKHGGDNTHTNQDKNFLSLFNVEELCLLVNALAKVNIKNEEILNLASNKIMNEININKHAINLLKNISELSTTTVEGASIVSKNISDNYNKINKNLTERDISTLIQFILLHKNTKKNDEHGEENELEAKLIESLRKVNYISEQSIALILNACSKGYEKNKKLLDILKIIIIMKIKNENNKCSDIFISSITHSYASFYYRDKILFNLISDYTCKNINSMNIKSLIIILNSFVNIQIINLKLFSAAIDKLADKNIIQALSNQCTSNLVTILTKSYNYLDRQKVDYIFKHVIKRIKWEYAKYLEMKKKKKKNTSNFDKNYSGNIENLFISSFLMKHLTNILNNFSKLNYADNDVFEIFTYLILKNKNDINKLDFMNIASAYSRHGYINKEIYQLIKKYSKKYITSSDLKYVEFINMLTSIANFYLVEKNSNSELEIQKGDEKRSSKGSLHEKNENLKNEFKDILNMIINMIKSKSAGKIDVPSKEGDTKVGFQECSQKCKPYNSSIICDKNIIENLSLNHLCSILSTLSKLNIHDETIFKNILNNLKKKIFKMDSKCLSIYLLYISKFNITLDGYIRSVLSKCFLTAQQPVVSKDELNGDIPIEEKQIVLNKMEKLYNQLKTNDLVNTVYIIRCMIKNDLEYKSSMPIIYRYLNNIYKICNNKNEEKVANFPNIIKIDDIDIDEKQNMKNRKMNIHCSSILINTLIILNTHIYNNDYYSKLVIYLLFYTFKHIYELLDLGISIKKAIDEESDKQTDYIKDVIKKKMDSASIRQINMAALMLYHFTPLNKYTFMNKQINCNKHMSILNNYPTMILSFLWFFVKYAPFVQFEKYNSIYNSITSDKILINYNYDNNDLYFNTCEDQIEKKKKKYMDCNHSLIPHVSHNEISIYSSILNVLKKKKKMEYQVFSSFPIYLYSIDILIMPRQPNVQN